jgi:hypothetical protein
MSTSPGPTAHTPLLQAKFDVTMPGAEAVVLVVLADVELVVVAAAPAGAAAPGNAPEIADKPSPEASRIPAATGPLLKVRYISPLLWRRSEVTSLAACYLRVDNGICSRDREISVGGDPGSSVLTAFLRHIPDG